MFFHQSYLSTKYLHFLCPFHHHFGQSLLDCALGNRSWTAQQGPDGKPEMCPLSRLHGIHQLLHRFLAKEERILPCHHAYRKKCQKWLGERLWKQFLPISLWYAYTCPTGQKWRIEKGPLDPWKWKDYILEVDWHWDTHTHTQKKYTG